MFKYKIAFTIVEIIITLIIIGLVSILTLPTVLNSYKKKTTAIRVEKIYNTFSQAIKLSEIENGPVSQWNIDLSSNAIKNTELVVKKYISPYINNLKFCENNIDDSSGKCGSYASYAGQGYYLPDGTTISFVAGGNSYNTNPMINDFILAMSIDLNAGKKPNLLGYDTFYFVLNKEGFGPYGFDHKEKLTRNDILNGYTNSTGKLVSCRKTGVTEEDSLYRHGCTLLLMLDNWEFKKDYPW